MGGEGFPGPAKNSFLSQIPGWGRLRASPRRPPGGSEPLMPKIRLILEDDTGDTIEQTFALEGDLEHLDGIDEAVEQFKNDALSQIERALLQAAQERALTQEKKTDDPA